MPGTLVRFSTTCMVQTVSCQSNIIHAKTKATDRERPLPERRVVAGRDGVLGTRRLCELYVGITAVHQKAISEV